MIDLYFWMPVILGGMLAGASCAALGVYIVGMRIPFLAVCVSHAALAGAVFGVFFGLGGDWMMLPGLIGALAAAFLVGGLEGRGVNFDANIITGVLFSLSMGLAFLGIGLIGVYGLPDNDVRALLWGSLLICGWNEVAWMAGLAAALAVFILAFRKELCALLFSRTQAAAAGIQVGVVWLAFLVLTSTTLTVNFRTVGGLMIYSLITNPALAATQWACGHNRVLVLAIILGAALGLGGFFIAAWFDLPVGATIVILSSLLVGVAALTGAWQRSRRAPAVTAVKMQR